MFGFGVLLRDERCCTTYCSMMSLSCYSRIFCRVSSGAISMAEHILVSASGIIGTLYKSEIFSVYGAIL